MSKEEIIKKINETFKGLEFDYLYFNKYHEDFEIHFKDGKYFCLGVRLDVDFREVR